MNPVEESFVIKIKYVVFSQHSNTKLVFVFQVFREIVVKRQFLSVIEIL